MALNSSAHKKILLQILADIYSTIGPFLGFKGGTAAYLFYGLDRFSVDLDFDLLDETKEEYVFKRINKILGKYGLIEEARMKRFNLLFILSYDKKEKNAQNVKIEINRRNFGSRYELRSYMGISMLVMVKEDMFTNKLVAMYGRLGRANRDIFDVCYFAQNDWPINRKIIEKRVQIPLRELLQKLIFALEKFNDHNILDGLGELISEKQKDWVKKKLKTETLFLLKLALENERG